MSLSDKIDKPEGYAAINILGGFLWTTDVKEFIKELKNDLHLNISTSKIMDRIIDELAGEDLI